MLPGSDLGCQGAGLRGADVNRGPYHLSPKEHGKHTVVFIHLSVILTTLMSICYLINPEKGLLPIRCPGEVLCCPWLSHLAYFWRDLEQVMFPACVCLEAPCRRSRMDMAPGPQADGAPLPGLSDASSPARPGQQTQKALMRTLLSSLDQKFLTFLVSPCGESNANR